MEVFIYFLIAFGLIFILPFICFAEGWIVGWLIKVIFGSMFISGLNLIGIHIDINSIPLFCGVLSIIGSFFKSSTTGINQNKKSE